MTFIDEEGTMTRVVKNLLLMTTLCVGVFWVFMAPQPAQADPPGLNGLGGIRGGESLKTSVWVSLCTSTNQTLVISCTSYAIGLFDGLILWYANSNDPIKICIPEKQHFINAKQTVDIGLEYVRRHPDSNSQPIAVVLRDAIKEAFPQPCSEM